MKKLIFSIILISFFGIASNAQESVPFSLSHFFEQYGNSIDEFVGSEQMNKSFTFDRYFLNVADTLLWPDNFNLEDRFYKHRLGPNGLYLKFNSFKKMSSGNFNYGLRNLDELKLIKSKSTRYFDQYRVLARENHIFNNNNFFGSDSIVSNVNYYDIISWFNPATYDYEWRINKIFEKQTANWMTPQTLQLNFEYLVPKFQKNISGISNSIGYGVGLKTYWLLGGKKSINYSIKSGLGFSSIQFKINNSELQFVNTGLVDKDNYPFSLKSSLSNFSQTLSFQLITLPVQLQFSKYFKNGKFAVSIYGGLNLHLPINAKTNTNSGEVTYSGKYKFDFSNDSILLENLDSYNFKTFTYKDINATSPKLNDLFVSTEFGGDFNWYLKKRWVVNFNLGYMQSLTPIYSNSNQTLTYNIIEGSAGKTFKPSLNSFLALQSENSINFLKLGFGINYIIEKPIIPHGKVGYRNGEISKLVKNNLVLTSGSYSQSSKQKVVNITVSGATNGLFGSRIGYRYVGPTSKYFKQGKLSSGSKNGNKLTFMVPDSNVGAKLYLEEPYGFNLKLENIKFTTGGLYGDIKVLNCEDIWKERDNGRNLSITFEKLRPLNIFLIDYKYSFDDKGIHRQDILTKLRESVTHANNVGVNSVIYIVSDQPESFLIENTSQLDNLFERIDIKLQNTDDVSTNINGLKGFLNEQLINPRRDVYLNLFTTEEFIDLGKSVMADFSGILNIDNDFIRFSTFLYSYGVSKSVDFDNSLNYLKKIGSVSK